MKRMLAMSDSIVWPAVESKYTGVSRSLPITPSSSESSSALSRCPTP